MKIKRLIIKNHPRINDCDRLLSGGVNLLPTECGEIISSLLNYSHLTDLLTSDDNPSDVFASIELENGNDSYKLQLNDGYYCYMKNDVVLSKEKAFDDECLSFFNFTNDKYYFFAGVRGEEKRPVRYYREELFNDYTGGKLLYKVINSKELYASYNQERGYFFLKNASNIYEHAELSFCDEAVLSLWCFLHKTGFFRYYQESAYGSSIVPPLFIFDLLPLLDNDQGRRKEVLEHLLNSENQILLFENDIPYTSLYNLEKALKMSGLAFLCASDYSKNELEKLGYEYFELGGYLESLKSYTNALAIKDTGGEDFLNSIWELGQSNGENSIYYIEKNMQNAFLYNGEKAYSLPVPTPENLPFSIYVNGEEFACLGVERSKSHIKEREEKMKNEVIIKDGTIEIDEGEYSFYDDIDYLFIPKSVKYIHPLSFDGISSIKKIEVDKENPVYHTDGNCIIKTDENMVVLGSENSVIPSYTKKIGKHAFNGRLALEKIVIPEGVEEIGYMAFALTGISDIDLPKSVRAVDSFAFALCKFNHSPFDEDKERFEIMGVGIGANLDEVKDIIQKKLEENGNDNLQ